MAEAVREKRKSKEKKTKFKDKTRLPGPSLNLNVEEHTTEAVAQFETNDKEPTDDGTSLDKVSGVESTAKTAVASEESIPIVEQNTPAPDVVETSGNVNTSTNTTEHTNQVSDDKSDVHQIVPDESSNQTEPSRQLLAELEIKETEKKEDTIAHVENVVANRLDQVKEVKNADPTKAVEDAKNAHPAAAVEDIAASAPDIGDHAQADEARLYPDLSKQLSDFMMEKEKEREEPMVPVVKVNDKVDTTVQSDDLSGKVAVEALPQPTSHHPEAPSKPQEMVYQPAGGRQLAAAPHMRGEDTETMQPLTLEQLSSLYYNPGLGRNAAFIERFVQNEIKRESHEFYEILLNYQRARKNLLQCEAALTSLHENYDQLQQQVWVTETHTATVKGTCGDNSRCTATHSYEQATLNQSALTGMKRVLESIQSQIQTQLSLHSYSSQLSRLQVESYIHNLFVSSPVLRDIPTNLPVSACERQSSDMVHQVDKLKTCISILFAFHRRPISDEVLLKNLQIWTNRLISSLLRVSVFEDHLYIINQLMRCPAGIGSWAAEFVQVPDIPSNEDLRPLMFGNAHLDYLMTALATVLMPTSARSDFLCQMQKLFTPGADNKTISWVMVDSDGEEDEDPQNAWLYLHENDVVAILKQLSMASIFKHIFLIMEPHNQDALDYDIRRTTESTMYRVFAFCTCLVGILGNGLKTYNMARYRQLNKRLGRMIRQCVQYVSDHWEMFRDTNRGILPPESLQKMQVEFDAFFLRAVNYIHMAQRLGSWQFIADMPFKNVSKETMWKLLWLLHQGHGQSIDVSAMPPKQQCINFVTDSSSRSQLSDILQRVPVSEGVYLLNTMTNMTECCGSLDVTFIDTVTMSVFEVSYLCPETRDSCSKMGRELLSAVITCHPFMMSHLIQKVHEHMEKLGSMAVYLFNGLSLVSWLPTDPDLVIIRQWLLNSDLGSPPHLLAQLILSNINWGKAQKGDRLMVPWRIHKQVAVLVVEGYQNFILGKHLGSVIMEGVKQVSAAVHQQLTTEQEFNSWCWDLILKLSLHRACLPSEDYRLAKLQGEPPDLNKDDTLLPLVKGAKEKNPTACCVALLLTKYGHGVTEFLQEGLPLLQDLTNQGLFKATLCIISYIMPLFRDSHKYILDSIRFQEILLGVLQADESYFRVVKGLLSYDFPGPITKLLICMVQNQVKEAGVENKDRMVPVIGLWAHLILKIPKWHLDRNCCCVLDNLIHVAFTHKPALTNIQEIFLEHYKEYCKHVKSQGVVSSIVSWVTSGVTLPSFLDRSSYPEFSWLAYMILSLEGDYEVNTRLWPSIQEEMLSNNKASIDSCLKKSIQKLKLEQAPTSSQLTIYRWSQQALDMPVSHPAAILTWQRFFVLYLGRLASSVSLPQRASVGERFFTGLGYSSMVKKMKKRLRETADYYLKQTTDSPSSEEEGDDGSTVNKDLLCRLARMFQTLQLWVEEPLLHDASLYLPSLPPQYQSDRLLTVFQNNMTPWLEFIDTNKEENTLVSMATEWKQTCSLESYPKSAFTEEKTKPTSGEQRILSRLRRCDKPRPAPPVHPIKAPVPEISPVIMEDKTAILHLLQSDLHILKEYAGQFCSRMTQHISLDHYYLGFVKYLYKNVHKEVTVSLACSSLINPLHRCSKPGAKTISIEEKWIDPIKRRQIEENRAEFKQIVIENKQPPASTVVICAVHTENAITMLVKLYRACTDRDRAAQLNNIACTLFFHLGDIVTDSIQKYPPTQQFFSSCIEVLGQEFIQHDASQTGKVLKLALDRPELGGMLAPHFLPNLAGQHLVEMYGQLVNALHSHSLELIFMLLTKFDTSKWLTEYNPNKQEMKRFVELLGQAFIGCGADPTDDQKLVFTRYLGHEKILLKHRFPLYLHEIIAILLQGSAVQKVSVECWETLHQHCFYRNGGQDEGAASQTYPDVSTNLSIDQVRDLLHWFGQEFFKLRTSHSGHSTFGLYPKWQQYVPHLAAFLRDMSKCLVHKMLPSLREATTNEGIESVWKVIVEGFAPWLQLIFHNDVPRNPWIADDRSSAGHMVRALGHVVGYAHFKTEDVRGKFYNDFLSLLWLYFASVLCKAEVTPDVVSEFNMAFTSLPWQHMMPNIHVMETMAQLKEKGSSLGFNLVADVVAMVPWQQVSAWYETYNNLETRVRYEGCLFILLIQAFTEKKYVENPDMEQVLLQSLTTRWQYLSPEGYRKACSWFLQGCDPKCLLLERTSPDAIGLRLLKCASGFNTEISVMWTPDWTIKRLSYLHTLCSLVCQCTYQSDWDPPSLGTVIINLLTEIETVETAVTEVFVRREESTDMMKEVLSLLNNCNPDNQGSSVIMESVLQWLQDSPQTILLSPCIHAASRNIASLSCMVQVVEQCIQLSFATGGGEHAAGTGAWDRVLAALQIPELNLTDFFMTCLQESSFLLLHCYILQQAPLCQSLTEEQGLIEAMLDWTEKAKPSADNESKLLLWWYKVLEMILRQLDYGRDANTCVFLVKKLAHKLQVYAEDRTSTGLLGAIGLGRKSALTERFRACSRAVLTFCSIQVLDETRLRLSPADSASTLPSAKQDLANLLSLRTNKKYQAVKSEVELTCDFVSDQSKCLRDVLGLMGLLRERFYPDIQYLRVMESSSK